MVLVLLGPADEDAAVAVQPGVARLDDPAACFPLGVLCLQLDLLAACADVRRERVGTDQLTDLSVVICPIQADALRLLRGRFGPLDRDRVKRALQQLVVVAVRGVVIEPDRDPRALRED